MSVGQKIKDRRKVLGITADELAEKLKVSRSTVFRWENGSIEKLPTSILEPVAVALHTTPGYLMGWVDEASDLPDNIIPMPAMGRIPLIGSIACGTPILAAQNVEDYVDIPKHVHADFALRCTGDSMINARILDGDVVYIHQQPTIENGEIAAVLIGEEATLKRVYINMDRIVLQPENPAYEPYIFVGEEMAEVHIIGKAVAFTSIVK